MINFQTGFCVKIEFVNKENEIAWFENKINELKKLLESLLEEDSGRARSICHKILGTAKSFGLYALEDQVEQIHETLKSNSVKFSDLILGCRSLLKELEQIKEEL